MARILLVDDSRFVARAMQAVLEQAGHEIVAVGQDGFEGVELYREHHPDLVLLDITMPNRDGRDCLTDLLDTDMSARVVMVSAIKEMDVVDGCLNAGALGYIQKPLQFGDDEYLQQFHRTIDDALHGERALPA